MTDDQEKDFAAQSDARTAERFADDAPLRGRRRIAGRRRIGRGGCVQGRQRE